MKKQVWSMFLCILIGQIVALEAHGTAQFAEEKAARQLQAIESEIASLDKLTHLLPAKQENFDAALKTSAEEIEKPLSALEAKITARNDQMMASFCHSLRRSLDIVKPDQVQADSSTPLFTESGSKQDLPELRKTLLELPLRISQLQHNRQEQAQRSLSFWKFVSQSTLFSAIVLGIPLLGLALPIGKTIARISRLEEIHRAQLDTTNDAVLFVDEHGGLMEINGVGERFFSALDDAGGRALLELVGNRSTELRQSLEKARDSGMLAQHESIYAHNGITSKLTWKLHWLSLNKMWLCSVEKRDEESLRVVGYRTRMRAIFDGLLIGIVLFHKNGLIESVNNCAEELFEFPAADLVDKSFVSLFSLAADATNDPQSFFEKLLESSSISPIEIMMRKKGGTEFPVELSLFSFGGDSDSLYIANVVDVTQRYEIERVKREFNAMITHDLRTPLTSMQLFLDMLCGEMYELPRNLVETAKDLSLSVARVIEMINSMLEIEKLEAGKLKLSIKQLPIEQVLVKAMSSIKLVADYKQVSIIMGETAAIVDADEQRLIQVVVNLLANAIKFSPVRGTVTISTTQSDAGVEVRVTDEGKGIPAEFCQKIFNRFEQVELADARLKGGTGLGLTVCKALIELHGGQIGVNSEVGQGSTFWFSVPRHQKLLELVADSLLSS